MQEVKIEKVVLSIGGIADTLERGEKLLINLTDEKPIRRKSVKRIPSLGVRPGLEVGVMVTLRGEKALKVLKRLLGAVDNKIKRRQISENTFSFGIKEYIEIPEMEYLREVGIMGLDISVTFVRSGKRIIRRKMKPGKIPKRQNVSEEEILEYIQTKLNVELK